MNSAQALQALQEGKVVQDSNHNVYYRRDKSIFCNGVLCITLPDTAYTFVKLKDD